MYKHGYTEKGFMFVEIEGITFEKYPTAGTVNIYCNGYNTNCFTHYGIKDDMKKFIEVCEQHFNEDSE